MSDPVETGITVSTGAVGGALLTKLVDFFLGRHAKKLDRDDEKLDLLLKEMGELKSFVTLAVQELRGDIEALHRADAGFAKDQEKQDERINGVAANHSQRLRELERRMTAVETRLEERLPRRSP